MPCDLLDGACRSAGQGESSGRSLRAQDLMGPSLGFFSPQLQTLGCSSPGLFLGFLSKPQVQQMSTDPLLLHCASWLPAGLPVAMSTGAPLCRASHVGGLDCRLHP